MRGEENGGWGVRITGDHFNHPLEQVTPEQNKLGERKGAGSNRPSDSLTAGGVSRRIKLGMGGCVCKREREREREGEGTQRRRALTRPGESA